VERSREYIAVFLVSWGLVLPFVVFQVELRKRRLFIPPWCQIWSFHLEHTYANYFFSKTHFIIYGLSNSVVFQGLLSARDAYMIEHYNTPREDLKPSASVTVSPLLALLGVWWVVTTFVSCSVKTAYQEARESVQHDVGLRVLYHI
jgi:hypothetical protein